MENHLHLRESQRLSAIRINRTEPIPLQNTTIGGLNMTDIIEELTGGGNAPPWLSGPLREARDMAYYAKLVAAIFAVLMLLAGLWNFISALAWSVWGVNLWTWSGVIYNLAGAFILVFIALNIQRKIINAIDQNRIAQAKNDIIVWMILGIIFGLIPGILLLLSKIKLDEATSAPQYTAPGQAPPAQYNYGQQAPQQGDAPYQYQQQPPQQYQAPQQQAYQQQPPQQYQAPPQPVGAPQPAGIDTAVICPNCGAQIPAYMHTCPKCGAPRPGTQL